MHEHDLETRPNPEEARPLAPETRARLSGAFSGGIPADVRVHRGPRADALARAHGAHAWAIGTDIGFRGDKYRPGTPAGDWLIAHELAHVAQREASPAEAAAVGVDTAAEVDADRGAAAAVAHLAGLRVPAHTPRSTRNRGLHLGICDDEPSSRGPVPPTPSPGPPTPVEEEAEAEAPERTYEPAVADITHQVAEGETLSELARRYYGDGSAYQRIALANPTITDADVIRVGEELTIPDAPAELVAPFTPAAVANLLRRTERGRAVLAALERGDFAVYAGTAGSQTVVYDQHTQSGRRVVASQGATTPGGFLGSRDPNTGQVNIRAGLSNLDAAAVLLHEAEHSLADLGREIVSEVAHREEIKGWRREHIESLDRDPATFPTELPSPVATREDSERAVRGSSHYNPEEAPSPRGAGWVRRTATVPVWTDLRQLDLTEPP